MFHVNAKRLLREEKEKGVANVSYYEGQCLTCEYCPDREIRASCERYEHFSVTAYTSRFAGTKTTKHLCKNWVLCSEITSSFKKNKPEEAQNPPQNGFKGKFQRNNK